MSKSEPRPTSIRIFLADGIEQGRRPGLSVARAVVAAGSVRLRPILMTTATTVLGMTPLGLGEGAEIMQALAVTVVGGLLVGSLMTLVVVPSLYLLVAGLLDTHPVAAATRGARAAVRG